MKYIDKEDFKKSNPFSIGDTNKINPNFFTGTTYMNSLAKTKDGKIEILNVTFEPGVTTNWHIHESKNAGDQILICIAGEGWFQEWGKDVVELKEGDVVIVPANIKHWHGAKYNSFFSHLVLFNPSQEIKNIMLEPIDHKFYQKLK